MFYCFTPEPQIIAIFLSAQILADPQTLVSITPPPPPEKKLTPVWHFKVISKKQKGKIYAAYICPLIEKTSCGALTSVNCTTCGVYIWGLEFGKGFVNEYEGKYKVFTMVHSSIIDC